MAKYLDNDGLLYFWQKIKNTFALVSHSHAISDVTDLQTTLNGKAASSHSHAIADVTNLQTTLDGKAPKSHASSATTYGAGTSSNYGHVKLSDSTSGTAAAASGGTAATPKAVKDALDAAKSYADSLDTGVTGVKGNAETDYRTGNVNLTPANIGAAAASHTHTIANVTGLQSALDGKAASSHSHAISDVTNLQTELDGKADDADFTGATASAAGARGLVPAPAKGDQSDVLFGDGTWGALGLGKTFATQSSTGKKMMNLFLEKDGTTIGTALEIFEANATTIGLMSNSDKSKLDALPTNSTLQSTYALKSEIVGMYKYKGSVADDAHLPTTGQTTGDVYNIESAGAYGGAGANVAWNGSAWDSLGEIFSITSITNSEIDAIVAS